MLVNLCPLLLWQNKARVFVPGKPLQTCLIFKHKVMWCGCGLAHKGSTGTNTNMCKLLTSQACIRLLKSQNTLAYFASASVTKEKQFETDFRILLHPELQQGVLHLCHHLPRPGNDPAPVIYNFVYFLPRLGIFRLFKIFSYLLSLYHSAIAALQLYKHQRSVMCIFRSKLVRLSKLVCLWPAI